MSKTIIAGVTAALGLALAAPRGALACGRTGGGGASYGGLAVAAVAAADVGMTVWDTANIFAGRPGSPSYATFEIIFAAPQLALGIAGLSSIYTGPSEGYALWMAALTLHGIWSLALSSAGTPREPKAVLSTDTAPLAASVAVGPTYVPLGPLAQIGFGLSGRF